MHQYSVGDISAIRARKEGEKRRMFSREAHKQRLLLRQREWNTPRLYRTLATAKLYIACAEIEKPHKHKLGKSVEEIAEELNLKPKTIKTYIQVFNIDPNTGPTKTRLWNIYHTFIFQYAGLSEAQIAFALNTGWEVLKNYKAFIEDNVLITQQRILPKPGLEVRKSDFNLSKGEVLVG